MKISSVCVSLSWPTGNNPISFRKLIQNNHTFGSISYWRLCYFSPSITFIRINISWDFSRFFLLPQHQSGRWRGFFLGLCRLWFCPLDISRSTFDQDFFRLFLYLKVFGIQNFYSILKYHHFILLMMALGVYFNCSSQSVPMKTLTRKSKNLVGWAFFSFVNWKIWGNS